MESGLVNQANLHESQAALAEMGVILEKALRPTLTGDSWQQEFDRSIRGENGALVYLRREGKMVGAGMVTPDLDNPRQANAENIGVLPEFQGQGLGKALMKAMIHHARTLGLETLILQVGKDNTRALNTYKSVGFTQDKGPEGSSIVYMRYDLKRLDAIA
jgi:[ribosomal protein S18]-alanine N-acetyltransferase